jgi:S1-C subfamily serine protease
MSAPVKSIHPSLLFSLFLALPALAGPRVIDDPALRGSFGQKLAKLCAKGDSPTSKELAKQEADAPRQAKPDLPGVETPQGYEDAIQSVAVLGRADHCGSKKCKKWHLRGTATAWCVGADGLFVTNFHCFERTEGKMVAIYMLDGRIAPVVEILAADPDRDVCLFRVAGKGFKPLPLGDAAPVGSAVHVISHPDNQFYTQTSGEVARYYRHPPRGKRKAAVWMSITADYAKGSSGGPVLNSNGEVVGMVSSTRTIFYGPRKPGGDKGPPQMVIKSCVPGDAIRKLLSIGEK